MKLLLTVFLLAANILSAQVYEINGTIRDSETGLALSYASIRIDGTTNGTSSNGDGYFTLKLKNINPTLIFSYVGYQTDTLEINNPLDYKLDIKLKPYPVKLGEVIVNASENPAYRIIREAINRKDENRRGLVNFEYNAYSKRLVKSAGEIALIEEVFLKGYNKINKWEKEFTLSYHKTENERNNKTTTIDISDEYYIDFSRDTLELLMNTIFLPLADNAFDYYDYKLLEISETETGESYRIQVIPLSKIQPLLEGEITIEGNNYALTSIDLKTNKGVRFPFVTNLSIKYLQQLGKYGGYWLPNYVENTGEFDVNFQGLIGLETMDFKIINNFTNYKINQAIPDTVLNIVMAEKLKAKRDTTLKFPEPVELTREEINKLRPIPLTQSEVTAYETLDSTKTLEKMVKFNGALSGLIPDDLSESEGTGGESSFSFPVFDIVTNYLYFSNNRVSGIVLGPRYDSYIIKKKLSIDAGFGYSFNRKELEGNLQFNYKPDKFFIDEFKFSVFHKLKHNQENTPYKDLFNSAFVTLGFTDQFDYYKSTGFGLKLTKKMDYRLTTELEFTSENQKSIEDVNYQSIFNINRVKRINPKIDDGIDNSISLGILWGKDPNEVQLSPESGVLAKVELSNPFLGSVFNYKKLSIKGQLQTETFYNELFIAPYLSIMYEADLLTGDYGHQHIITPNVTLGIYAPQGTFKGLNPYEYIGTKLTALYIEHNWRTVPFQALGLDFISDLYLDFITGASILKIWNDSEYPSPRDINKPYWETYIGISKILGLIRIDVSYSSFKDVSVTASLGMIL